MRNEIVEFLKANVMGNTIPKLIDMIEKEFGVRYTKDQIKYYKAKHNLRSYVDGTFSKGQTPHNKKPIGSEFVDERGYVHIKTGEPNTWEWKQRYIYRKYKGEIPEGYNIVFADGDKNNFDIDNLMLVADREKLVMNSMGLFTSNAEVTKSGHLLAQLINATYDKTKILSAINKK